MPFQLCRTYNVQHINQFDNEEDVQSIPQSTQRLLECESSVFHRWFDDQMAERPCSECKENHCVFKCPLIVCTTCHAVGYDALVCQYEEDPALADVDRRLEEAQEDEYTAMEQENIAVIRVFYTAPDRLY